MTESQALGYKLLNDATIKTLCGNPARVYHGIVPETVTTFPMINFFMVSDPNLYCNARRPHYQISCRSKSAEQCKQVADAIINCIYNYQGRITSGSATFDIQNIYYDDSRMIIETGNVYHIPIDIYISFKNT